jgi:hypothetical protein
MVTVNSQRTNRNSWVQKLYTGGWRRIFSCASA